MFSKSKYLCILVLLLMLVSCNSTTKEESTSLLDLESKCVNLEKENNNLKTEINKLRDKIENINSHDKLQYINNQDVIEVEKNYFNKSLIIDGGYVETNDDKYYIKYNDEIFISTNFIKDFYNIENCYGIVIKGFPIEDYIIKTDGILYISDLLEGLAEEYKKQSEIGNYDEITKELDGLKIVYGEVGLREYIITKPLYMTQRGITVGSTRRDVIKAYGKLGKNNENKWCTFVNNAEYSEGCTFTFVFDETDFVTEIHYGWKN